MNSLILNTSVMNEGLKTPLNLLVHKQQLATNHVKSEHFSDFAQEHRQNHWIQQSPKGKCRFSLWYRQNSSLNIFRFLKSVTSEAFKNKQNCFYSWLCAWMASGGEERLNQNFSWLCTEQSSAAELFLAQRITVLEGIPDRGKEKEEERKSKPLEMSCHARVDLWLGQGILPSLSPQLGDRRKSALCKLQKLSWITAPLNAAPIIFCIPTEICNEPLNNSWTRNHWAVLNETGEMPFHCHLSIAHSSTALLWMWWVAKIWRIPTKLILMFWAQRKSHGSRLTFIRKCCVCLQGSTCRKKTYLLLIFKRHQSLTSTFWRGLISKSISSHQLSQKYHRIHHFPNCYIKAMFRRVKCALRQEQIPIRNAMKGRRKRPANEYTTCSCSRSDREKVGKGEGQQKGSS